MKKALWYGLVAAISYLVGIMVVDSAEPKKNIQEKIVNYRTEFFKNPSIKVYHGPFNAIVLKVRDADTIAVRVFPWPSVAITTSVRLRGVDAPEYRRAKCPQEKLLSKQATNYVKSLIKPGDRVQVYNVAFGKYAGRVIAGIKIKGTNDFDSLSEILLAAGYAKPYNGGKKKAQWCEWQKN